MCSSPEVQERPADVSVHQRQILLALSELPPEEALDHPLYRTLPILPPLLSSSSSSSSPPAHLAHLLSEAPFLEAVMKSVILAGFCPTLTERWSSEAGLGLGSDAADDIRGVVVGQSLRCVSTIALMQIWWF